MKDDTMQVTISLRVTVKLIISGELDPAEFNEPNIGKNILTELNKISVSDLLNVVDCNNYGTKAEVSMIPQGGHMETVQKVPYYFVEKGNCTVDYAQLGFYLKKDLGASLCANQKFGENHGKIALSLGLVGMKSSKFVTSSLTYAFCELGDELQKTLMRKLMMRIPIIQILLKAAGKGTVNGYDPMSELSESTRERRSLTVRTILSALYELDDQELKNRIQNIRWDK